MKQLFCLIVFACLAAASNAETITVCLDGSCDYTDIQEAINAASDGDVIEISGGTYYPAATIDMGGKAVALRGEVSADGQLLSTLNGGSTVQIARCISGEGATTRFVDLIFLNGNSTNGGGMLVDDSSPYIARCEFIGNTASDSGGALFICCTSSPTIDACTFRDNQALSGGGIATEFGSPTINGCTFIGNQAESGGGITNDFFSTSQITSSTFVLNIAGTGGAILNTFASSPTIVDCTITENQASSGFGGGGIYSSKGSSTTPNMGTTIICENSPNQVFGEFIDLGENCIQESCIDCESIDCPADLTGDGVVDGEDLGLLFVQWGACDVSCPADLSGDGNVDGEDLGLLFVPWGACP